MGLAKFDEEEKAEITKEYNDLKNEGNNTNRALVKLAKKYNAGVTSIHCIVDEDFKEENYKRNRNYVNDIRAKERGYMVKEIKIPYAIEKELETIPMVEYDDLREQG